MFCIFNLLKGKYPNTKNPKELIIFNRKKNKKWGLKQEQSKQVVNYIFA
jgi:hypothetical protein